MSLNTTMDAATDSQPCTANEVPPRKPIRRASVVEQWLQAHITQVALAVTAAGFGVRIAEASRTYFNPDEVLHYLLINEPSLFLAYKASLTNAHPPMVYFLLYLFHFLGRSELALRLPLVLAGTASC